MAKVPEQIGKYKITEQLDKGGMGTIYVGVHPTLNRKVILKKLTFRGSSEIRERFKREAEFMMDLKNDYIVNVYDHFKEGTYYYLVLEYIDGISLNKVILRDGALDNITAAYIALGLAEALKYIHSKGIVHRDIKPGNVLISKEGDIKVTDFGIASQGEDDEFEKTSKSSLLGTPAYMSPEQLRDTATVDYKADIYSFAVVVYEMLTGLKPFMGEFNEKFYKSIERGRYYPIRKMNPQAARTLASLSRRAMNKKQNRRLTGMDKAVQVLNRYIQKHGGEKVKELVAELVSPPSQQSDDFGTVLIEETRKQSVITRNRFRSFIKIGGILVLATALFASVLWGIGKGYHYELLNSSEKGGLYITVAINKEAGHPSTGAINAVLYRELQNKIDPVDIELIFNEEQEDEEFYYYTTEKFYLDSANYRLKTSIINEFKSNSFYLNPVMIQKKSADTYFGREIALRVASLPKIPLKLNAEIKDIETGEDISKGTEFSVKQGKNYVDVNKLKKPLRSGNRYIFKFERDGYYRDYYTIEVSPYETDVNFEVGLIPRAGKVNIKADTEGVKVFLNDSEYYVTGGVLQAVKKMEKTTLEPRSLILSPGEYKLSFVYSRKIRKDYKLIVKSDEELTINFTLDKEKKEITITED